MSTLAQVTAPEERRLATTWLAVLLAASVTLAAILIDPREGWSGLLTAAIFGIGLALGGGVFAAIQLASGAVWWLPLRRVPLLVARTLPVPAAALLACFAFALETLYPWARAGALEASPLLAEKAVWLQPSLFLARAVIVLVVWLALVARLARSLEVLEARPTREGGRRARRAGIAFLLLLGPTLSVAAWDWSMSLEPEWYSTMYGVYVFAGTFLGGIAAVSVLALGLEKRDLAALTPELRHDLGKLLFAFSTFWAYIWFCQYLLIWYANLPEETGHYVARFGGGWSSLFWLNPILNWVVPFVVLLSVSAKRHPATLRQVAVVVLVGRWLDAYLLVAPAAGPKPAFPVGALGASVAVLGAMWLLAVQLRRRRAQAA